eukprot:gene13745-25752_t
MILGNNDQIDRTALVRKKGEHKRSAASAKVIEQNKALEEELKAAREAAAKAQSSGDAAALSQMEAGPFDLPNPGGGENLANAVQFNMVPGGRYGLIGRNGKGKSTLLKWIAARRDGCNTLMWRNATIHYVTQEVQLSDDRENWTPQQVVIDADIERNILLAEVQELEAKDAPSGDEQARLTEVHDRLVVIGADAAEGRAVELLVNLGFSEHLMARTMRELSGGWRVRVSLAAALFAKPDILLLDEPTNHLSIEAVLWLQQELATGQTWDRRVIITVSHDRAFLDAVCTDCLHISGAAKRVTQNKGNFTTWSKRRSLDQETWRRSKEQRQAKISHLLDFIQGAGTYANVMKQVNSKKKLVEKLELEAEAEAEKYAGLAEDEELPLRLQDGGLLDQPALQVKEVAFAYPGGPELFSNVEIGVAVDTRLVLLGENGYGKTTLVKLLLQELEPTRGTVVRDRRARIALVNQHHADQIDMDETPLEFMANQFPGTGSRDHVDALRSHLSGCGIKAELQGVPTRALSGGQRSRVAMAAVSYRRPHVLILDEPTNNLDLEAVAALADCVESFKGAVIIVSHDQYFVGRVAKEVWVVDKGRIIREDSFAGYIKKKMKEVK